MKKPENALDTVQIQLNSPVGPLFLLIGSRGLRGISWKKHTGYSVAREDELNGAQTLFLAEVKKQLSEFFIGQRRQFDLVLDWTGSGTPFQLGVWRQLQKIPYGTTIPYRELARRLGKPRAMRAVGSANGKNPFSIVVPCHRVIAADGSLGGFAGGLQAKTQLLELESR